MKTNFQHLRGSRGRSLGFGLVELMVAIMISSLTVLAIVQMMGTYGRQERLGGSVNETQNNALQALNILAADAREAGYGYVTTELQDCTNPVTASAGVVASVNGIAVNALTTAVDIVDGDSGPDEVSFRFAKGLRPGAPITLGGTMASPVADVPVTSTFGVQVGQLAILSNTAKQCTLFQVTGVNSASTPKILETATAVAPATIYNPSSAPTGWVSYSSSGKVHPVGTLIQRTYSVSNTAKALQMIESVNLFGGASAELLVDGIVDMQAQYGIADTAASESVTQWVSATGTTWAAPTAANRKRIKAIRFAIVARSKVEDSAHTAGAIALWPTVSAATNTQGSEGQTYTPPNSDRKMRHRVLRAVIPLKNLQWGTS